MLENNMQKINEFYDALFYSQEDCAVLSDLIREKYEKKDPLLYELLSYSISNEEVIASIKKYLQRELHRIGRMSDYDPMKSIMRISYTKELDSLETKGLDIWIEEYFSLALKPLVSKKYWKQYCYIYYGYRNFRSEKLSVYNSETFCLEKLYQCICDKGSQLSKYGLITVDSKCEILAINPPRLYDSKIDKTIQISNVSKELLEVILELKNTGLFEKVSIRCSNLYSRIHDGKYKLETIQEGVEFGSLFTIKNLGKIPVTKLHSEDYKNFLWIKVDPTDITFEELCECEENFENAIVTQVLHLQYKKENEDVLITHIDHEYAFYSSEDYKIRKNDSSIKGTAHRRLKSFKIDEAKIPFDYPCRHNTNVLSSQNEVKSIEETVPFLIFVLKCYFKNLDLIDEYFKCLADNPGI